MADPNQQINQEMAFDATLASPEKLKDTADFFLEIEKAVRSIARHSIDITKNQEKEINYSTRTVEIMEDRLENIQAQIEKSSELNESYKGQLKEIEKFESAIHDILKDMQRWNQLSSEQKKDLIKLLGAARELRKEYFDTTKQLEKIKKFMTEAGVGGIAQFITRMGTAAGVIGIMVGLARNYLIEQEKWIRQNYALYGSVVEVENATRRVAQTNKLLQAEAREATKALADVSIAKASLEELAGTIGDANVEIGISTTTAAKFAKQMQVLGYTNAQTAARFEYLKRAAQTWGITGADADRVFGHMNDTIRTMRAYLGSDTAFKQFQENIIKIAGAAKKAGADLDSINSVLNDLVKNRMKFILLFGDTDWINEKDTTKLFQTMAGNAAEALSTLEDMPAGIRAEMAEQLYGMSYETLQQMDKMAKEGAASLNKLKPDKLNDELRRSTSASREFRVALENLGQALVQLMTILQPVVTGITKAVTWFNGLPNVVKNAIGAVLFFVIALKGLKFAFGGLTAPFKWIIGMFKGTKDVATKAAEATTAAGKSQGFSLKKLGQEIVGFLNEFRKLSLGAVFKAALAIVILGGALIVLGYAARGIPPGRLLELSVSLVALGAALWVFSKISTNLLSIVKAAGALIIISVALFIFGKATAGIDVGKIIGVAFALPLLGASLLILGQIGKQQFMGIMMAGVGLIIISAALLIMGFAMKMAPASQFMLMAVALVAFAVALGIAGAIAQALAIPMLIFAGVMVVTAVALIVLGFAIQFFAPAIPIMLQMPAAAGAFALAMVALAAGMLLVLPLLPLAVTGIIVFALLRVGLWLLSGAFTPAFLKGLPILSAYFASAMSGLASGIGALVGSKYIRFLAAAKSTSMGLGSILGALTAGAGGIQTLPIIAQHFSTAMEQLASSMPYIEQIGKGSAAMSLASIAIAAISTGLARLGTSVGAGIEAITSIASIAPVFGSTMASLARGVNVIMASDWRYFPYAASFLAYGINRVLSAVRINADIIDELPRLTRALNDLGDISNSVVGGQGLINMANSVDTTISVLGRSLDTYAVYVERSADRITAALDLITTKAAELDGSSVNTIVRNNAIVTVKTAYDQANLDDNRHKQSIEKLDGIRSVLAQIGESIGNAGGSGLLEDIKKLLETYLPPMAEDRDSGLASAVNKWNSGMG